MALFRVAVLHFFCFLLLLLLAFTTPPAQARESQFFSKAERYTAPKEATSSKGEELPAAKKGEEVHYKPDNGGGGRYGLYGHGPERLIPAATTASPAFSTYGYNEGAGENTNTESVPAEFNNVEVDGAVSYGNKEFNAAGDRDMNKNYAGNTPTYNAGSNPQKYELDGYKYNKEASTRYQNRGEQYGMSDTRFLDNGRYFYDQTTEGSYRNGRYVDAARGKYPGGGYGSFGGGQTFANGGYTFGNNLNNNNDNSNVESSGYEENNNSMQGNRSNQQQEEYVP